MKVLKQYVSLTLLLLILTGVVSCNKETAPPNNFDRGPLLENLGNNLIVPAYDSLAKRTQRLHDAADDFTTTPDQDHLNVLRERWLDAYLAYQRCGFYNFGPADQHLLNTAINTYPTSKTEVNGNISSGSYNLSAVSSNDAKGFSALDYLLFGLAESDEDLLDLYSTDGEAAARKQYMLDVVNDIAERSQEVFEEWSSSGGDYLSTFTSRTGNDVGSSVGMLINAAIQYHEVELRDNKIGKPLGVRSLNIPIPNNCEALHAEQSILLATESVKTLQDIYLGRAQENGIGFDDYLVAINARYNNGSLDDALQAQLTQAVSKVSVIPEPYSETVENNPTSASQAYQELQKLTILMKADMTSAMGILITYQDNDGD